MDHDEPFVPETENGVGGEDEVDFVDPKRDKQRYARLQRQHPAPSADGHTAPGQPAQRTATTASISDDGTSYLINTSRLHHVQARGAAARNGVSGTSPLERVSRSASDEPSELTPLISTIQEPPSYPDNGTVVRGCGLPARWSMSIFGFFIFTFLYGLRFNVSVAVVAMAGNVTKYGNDNGTIIGPEFDWTKKQQGYLNSAFFYGYMAMSLPAGWLAGRFGAHRTIAIGMLINSLVCIATPPVARFNLDALIGLRVLQGLAQAVVFPAYHTLLGKWAPKKNLGLMAGIAYPGGSAGVILAFTVGSVIDVHGFGSRSDVHYDGDNWPSIFYTFGAGSLVATLVWWIFVYESPAVHPRITKYERCLIETDIAAAPKEELQEFSVLDVLPLVGLLPASIRRRIAVPWRSILISRPVIAMTIAQACADFGNYTLLTCVPTYIHEVVGMDILNSGTYAALPYICQWGMALLVCSVANSDVWQRRVPFIVTRKLSTIFSQVGCAAALVAAAYSTSGTVAIAMVTMAGGVQGALTAGSVVNHVDLSPRYAGIMYGYTNFFGSIAGVVGPYIADALTPHKTRAEWKIVFFITAGVYLFGALSYGLFASAERQPWANGEIFPDEDVTPGDGDDEYVGAESLD